MGLFFLLCMAVQTVAQVVSRAVWADVSESGLGAFCKGAGRGPGLARAARAWSRTQEAQAPASACQKRYPRERPPPHKTWAGQDKTQSQTRYNHLNTTQRFHDTQTPRHTPFHLSIDLVDGDRRNGRRIHIQVHTSSDTSDCQNTQSHDSGTRNSPKPVPPIRHRRRVSGVEGRYAVMSAVMDLGLESCGRLMGCDAR